MPPRARACPECGSDDRTGWAPEDEIEYASVDLPDDGDPPEIDREASSYAARVVIVVLIILGLLGLLGLLLG